VQTYVAARFFSLQQQISICFCKFRCSQNLSFVQTYVAARFFSLQQQISICFCKFRCNSARI